MMIMEQFQETGVQVVVKLSKDGPVQANLQSVHSKLLVGIIHIFQALKNAMTETLSMAMAALLLALLKQTLIVIQQTRPVQSVGILRL